MSTATGNQACVNEWCDRPRKARGFCARCYSRGFQAGDMRRCALRPFEVCAQRHEDVDETAVERLVAGDIPERTTIGEREAAIRRLHATGLSDPQIAARIGATASTVFYRRQALGLPANNPKRTRQPAAPASES